MDFISTIGRAIDPEAFEEDLWKRDDLPFEEKADRLRRKNDLTRRISEGLMAAEDRFKTVELRFAEVQGDYYVIDGYGEGRGRTLALSERRLGAFLATLLRLGGGVVSLHALNPGYANSHVSAVVRLPPSRKAEFEAATGLVLRDPPRIVLN